MALTILIADDNLMFRKLIRRYLEDQPAVVVAGEAGDGEEAARKAKELRPDVVILDVNMAGHPVATTCAAIQNAASMARIYLCSAHADRMLREIAMSVHANGVVRKSSLRSDLMKIIHPQSRTS